MSLFFFFFLFLFASEGCVGMSCGEEFAVPPSIPKKRVNYVGVWEEGM